MDTPTNEQHSDTTTQTTTFRDRILEMLPAERRLDMMKVVNDAGLRADDEAFALFYVMGYIKTLYEDMPDAVEQMNHVIWEMAGTLHTTMQDNVRQTVERMRMEMQAQTMRNIAELQQTHQRLLDLLQAHDDKIAQHRQVLEAENNRLREGVQNFV